MHPLAYLRRALSVASAAILIASGAFATPPTADDGSNTGSEDIDIPAIISATDNDVPSEGPMTFTIKTGPSSGILSGTPPNLTYTPNANFNGADSFTFTATNALSLEESTNTATFSITVNPVNDAPTADPQSVSTDEDTPKVITLTGSDIDSPSVAFVYNQPAHGSVTGSGPNVTYAPAQNYHGTDSFTFHTTDGSLDSNDVTVSITVTPVNDAPTAGDQTVSTNEDTPKVITLAGADVDGTSPSFVYAQPAHGVVSGTGPNVTYTPSADYNGPDSFTYHTTDGLLNSVDATVTITVNPVNDAPVANAGPDQNGAPELQTVTLTGAASSDPDPGETATLTYAWTQTGGPVTVTLSGANTVSPTFTAPDVSPAGADFTFQLTATDHPGLLSSSDSVVIHVQNVNANNHPPQVTVDPIPNPISGDEVNLVAHAIDPDAGETATLVYQWSLIGSTAVITNPTSPTASFVAPAVAADTNVTVRIQVSDGQGANPTVDVPIVIHPNRLPVAVAVASATIINEGTLDSLFGGDSSDPDGDAIVFQWTQVSGPAVTIGGSTSSTATFTAPNVTPSGADLVFRLKVTDARGGQSTKDVSVHVQNVNANNHSPTVTISAPETAVAGTVVRLTANVSDPDAFDAPFTVFKWDQTAAPYILSIDGANTAVASFVAPAVSSRVSYTFRVTVADGQGGSDTEAVTVTIVDPAQAFNGVPLIADPKIFPSPFSPSEGGATIRYTLRNPADVTIVVSDIFGLKVREFRVNSGESGGTAGDNDVHWDGRNEGGDSVANGAYVVQIRASDGASSAKKTERVGVIR